MSKGRLILLACLIISPTLLLSGCSSLSTGIKATINYSTYETTSLGPDPIHEAEEDKKFLVLQMEITNTSSTEEFPIHRIYFYLLTEDQRFMAYYDADMPDIRYPIDNNSEVNPGGTVKQTTLFHVPESLNDYDFEYDYGAPVDTTVDWVETDLSW